MEVSRLARAGRYPSEKVAESRKVRAPPRQEVPIPERMRPSDPGADERAKGSRRAAWRLSRDEYASRFEACAGSLWTLAAGVLGGPAGAEDVLQEACLIGLEKRDQVRIDGDFRAWMGRIVRFVALNRLRRRARRRTRAEDPEVLDGAFAGRPAALAETGVGARGELGDDGGHFDDELFAALGELKPRARAGLLLRVVQELSYREIGGVLGVPEGTAMSDVHRARRELRARLGGHRRPLEGARS